MRNLSDGEREVLAEQEQDARDMICRGCEGGCDECVCADCEQQDCMCWLDSVI